MPLFCACLMPLRLGPAWGDLAMTPVRVYGCGWTKNNGFLVESRCGGSICLSSRIKSYERFRKTYGSKITEFDLCARGSATIAGRAIATTTLEELMISFLRLSLPSSCPPISELLLPLITSVPSMNVSLIR